MSEPTEVKVVDVVAPIPVTLAAETVRLLGTPASAPMPRQNQEHDPSLPARTTYQEDMTTAGQRRINLIWEYTQAIIALLVVVSTMACGVVAMVYDNKQIPTIIGVAFGMVTGFYFSRTNHAAIGGVGLKPEGRYEGR